MSSEPPKKPVKIFILIFTHLSAKKIGEKNENADHLAEFTLSLPGISALVEQSFYFIDKKYYSLSQKAH